MELGLWSMNTAASPRPDVLAGWLVECGFGSVWFGEHSHIPLTSERWYAGDPDILDEYAKMLDPLITAASVAAAQPDLIVGTAIALPLQRDLMSLAKELATLDHLTDGRFQFGIGTGWNAAELADHRELPWRSRYLALEERVQALRQAWDDPTAGFAGRFDRFSPSRAEPVPVRRGPMKIHAGLSGPLGRSHAARWADGWMPMLFGGDPRPKVTAFRREVEAAGRDPRDVQVTILLMTDPDPERIGQLQEAGVDRVVLGGGLPSGADLEESLHHWSATLLPQVSR